MTSRVPKRAGKGFLAAETKFSPAMSDDPVFTP